MRAAFLRVTCVLAVAVALGICAPGCQAASGRIIKVLPFYLDRQGRVALSPSLFERDAYQAQLRLTPAECSGLRFDVEWKAKQAAKAQLTLRAEVLTAKTPKSQPMTVEQPVRAGRSWRRWTSLRLSGLAFREAAELIAWRVTLWDADRLVAEQKSFLW
jgi:hypothetical protein